MSDDEADIQDPIFDPDWRKLEARGYARLVDEVWELTDAGKRHAEKLVVKRLLTSMLH